VCVDFEVACGVVCLVSMVVGATVLTTVCRWGRCPRCPGVGRCLSGVYSSLFLSYNVLCVDFKVVAPLLVRETQRWDLSLELYA